MCKQKKLFSSLKTFFGEPFPIFFLFFKKKKDFDSFTHRQPFFFLVDIFISIETHVCRYTFTRKVK